MAKIDQELINGCRNVELGYESLNGMMIIFDKYQKTGVRTRFCISAQNRSIAFLHCKIIN
jgi:hypothetical protein